MIVEFFGGIKDGEFLYLPNLEKILSFSSFDSISMKERKHEYGLVEDCDLIYYRFLDTKEKN